MPTPLFARTALASAVTVALIGAPVAIGAPAFGHTAEAAAPTPAQTSASVGLEGTPAPPDDGSTDSADDPSTLPAGPFAVRKAASQDTFALFDGDSRFSPDDPDFDHSDIVITLPDIDGADRDFVLVPGSALDLVTDDGHEPYAPGAHGNGDRTFAFDVAADGTIGEVTETTPGPGEDDDENTESPPPSPDPTPQPTNPVPTPEPTPTGTPDPTPDPTRSPTPGPTDDPGDDDDSGDGDQGGDGNDGDDSGSDDDSDGSGDGSGSGDDLTDDPSTGNGSDGNGGASDPGPTGAQDWVPTAPRRPDYTDPVPQPPGADGDDSITPDTDGSAPQAGDDDGTDDIATDSAADEDSGAAIPWQIAVVVGIGAAAIGFVLLVAGRRRAD